MCAFGGISVQVSRHKKLHTRTCTTVANTSVSEQTPDELHVINDTEMILVKLVLNATKRERKEGS